jgi:hypothetical protein
MKVLYRYFDMNVNSLKRLTERIFRQDVTVGVGATNIISDCDDNIFGKLGFFGHPWIRTSFFSHVNVERGITKSGQIQLDNLTHTSILETALLVSPLTMVCIDNTSVFLCS